MAKRISASVGKGGKNSPADVKVVQELLNPFGPHCGFSKLKTDGKPTPQLNEAIGKFQEVVCGFKPDRSVDPGKRTLKALNEGLSGFKAQEQKKAKADEKAAKEAAEKAKAKAIEAAKKAAEKAAKAAKAPEKDHGGFWSFLGEVADSVEKAAKEAADKAILLAKKTGRSVEEEIEKLMGQTAKEAERKAADAAKKAAEAAKKAADEEEKKKANAAPEPNPNKKGTIKWKPGVDKNVSPKLIEVIEIVAGHFDKPILVVGGRRDKQGQISAMWGGWDKHLKNGTIYPALRAKPALREELDSCKAGGDFAGFKKAMLDKCPWSQISRHLSGEAVDISTSTNSKILSALKDCLYYLPETSKEELDEKGKPMVKCHHFSLKKYKKPTPDIMKKWKTK